VLCKHEVVGSIPSGSTSFGRRRSVGELPDVGSISFRCILISFVGRESAWRLAGRKGRLGANPFSVVLRPPISDIVKRKRIRSRPDGGKGRLQGPAFCKDGEAIRTRCPFPFADLLVLRHPNPEQPVVGLAPDRPDSRMRLKQNWSFQRQERPARRLPIGGVHQGHALAMRAIKCLKGIRWMPWR
jgi:hypothetical protein